MVVVVDVDWFNYKSQRIRGVSKRLKGELSTKNGS